jgi:hypothetical protein
MTSETKLVLENTDEYRIKNKFNLIEIVDVDVAKTAVYSKSRICLEYTAQQAYDFVMETHEIQMNIKNRKIYPPSIDLTIISGLLNVEMLFKSESVMPFKSESLMQNYVKIKIYNPDNVEL